MVPAYQVYPGKKAVKHEYVCVWMWHFVKKLVAVCMCVIYVNPLRADIICLVKAHSLANGLYPVSIYCAILDTSSDDLVWIDWC